MKIFKEQIQMFVAGALALMGFTGLFWMPYYLIHTEYLEAILCSAMGGLALRIGIAMLCGNAQAAFWAKIYLFYCIFNAVAMISLHAFSVAGTQGYSWWRSASELLHPAILLGLLFWSQSQRFHAKPESTLEPTAIAK
jgi:hypothetical protein